MKNTFGFLIAGAMVMTCGFAKEPKEFPRAERVVPFTDLTEEMIGALLYGTLGDTVIECKEGTEFPLKFLANLNVVSVSLIPNLTVRIEKTVYFRLVGRKGYMSYDLVNWEKATKFFEGYTRTYFEVDGSGVTIKTEVDPD